MRNFVALGVLVLALTLLSGCAYYHVVQPGDTLYGLSKDYGVSVQEIQRSNPGVDPYNLQIGQRVKVPRFPNQKGSAYTAPRTARPEATPVPKPRPRPEATPEPRRTPDVNEPTPEPRSTTTAKKPEPRSTATVTSEKPRFIWPVQGGDVGTRYGQMRDGALTHGIEINAPKGAPVLASAGGKVILASSEFKGYGNMIVVRHDNNFFTIYSFNKKNLVKKGQRVAQGQKIAEVGDTGRAGRSTLHFQVRIGSKAVDPLLYLPQR